jgi:hypothetical protein
MDPWQDPNDWRNEPQFHTRKPCAEKGCAKPAGTWWSPIWCQTHNAERIDRINGRFAKVEAALGAPN